MGADVKRGNNHPSGNSSGISSEDITPTTVLPSIIEEHLPACQIGLNSIYKRTYTKREGLFTHWVLLKFTHIAWNI